MSEYKKYLFLNLKSGGLILESLDPKLAKKNPAIVEIMEKEGVSIADIKRGHNIANPIPYTTLSNMLASLMGGIPVPTKPSKRKRMLHDIQRPEICDILAKNAYYKLDTSYDDSRYVKTVVGSDGEYYHIFNDGYKTVEGSEAWQTSKLAINSNVNTKAKIITLDDGSVKTMKGVYSMNMLYRNFGYDLNNPIYVAIANTINDILGCDDFTKEYTFTEMAQAIYEAEKDASVREKVECFVNEIKSIWKGNYITSWIDAIFNYDMTSKCFITDAKASLTRTNCDLDEKSYKGKCFLKYNRGNNHRIIRVDGQIIVELTDPKQEQAIRENAGFCTFLEGGVCEVSGIENWEPIVGYKDSWAKISDENVYENTDNKQVM